MHAVTSTEGHLEQMSSKSIYAVNLVCTRVDGERSAQNQVLLESMGKRSDLQLRLQRSAEVLPVGAISFYTVCLVG